MTDPALVHNLKKILEGFDKGVFVRAMSGDHESDWAIKSLPYIVALAKVMDFVSKETEAADAD